MCVCGTERDPQNLAEQERKLREAGAIVVGSNAAATRLAGITVRELREARAQCGG
ncbi:MAG: hypothetical protein ACETWR_20925 [Anaerolineae bacterium]